MFGTLIFADEVIGRLSGEDVLVAKPSDHFCDSQRRQCMTVWEGDVIYEDLVHLNEVGSVLLAKKVEEDFRDFIESS